MRKSADNPSLISNGGIKLNSPGLFHTLRVRLIISVALVHVVLMGLFTWEAVDRQSHELREALIQQGDSLASLMVVATTNALLAEDLASLAEVTRRVETLEDVDYGEIIDVRGFILASTHGDRVGQPSTRVNKHSERFPLSAGDLILDIVEDVRIDDRSVGFVMLGLSTKNLKRELAATRNQGIQYILLALIIGSIVAWLLSMAVTRNLHELTLAAGRIGDGDLNVHVKGRGRDETSTLARAFNLMALSLQQSAKEIETEHRMRTEAERLACVGEMAASIAHEIRNPLSALINSVKLLGNPELPKADHEQVVDIVNNESLRLQRILNEFLAYARLPIPLLKEADITLLIRECADLMRLDPACSEQMNIDYRFDDTDNCLFDRDQIRQVLLNLMQNAFQAMGSEGLLSIRVKRKGSCLSISLVDNGCGIPDKMKKEVTKPFISARKGGTGLGLSVVSRILVQHGTTLTITSEKGVGTEVSFDLKVAS